MTKAVILKVSLGSSSAWNRDDDNKQINMIIKKEDTGEDIYYVTTTDKLININTKKRLINNTNINEILSMMQESIKNGNLKCLLDDRGYVYFKYYEESKEDKDIISEEPPDTTEDNSYESVDVYKIEPTDYDDYDSHEDDETDDEVAVDDVDEKFVMTDNNMNEEDMLKVASKILRNDIQNSVSQYNRDKNIIGNIYEFIGEMPPMIVTITAGNVSQYSPSKISEDLKGYLIYYLNNYVKKYLLEIHNQEAEAVNRAVKSLTESIERKTRNESDLQTIIRSLTLAKKVVSIQFSEDYLKKEGHKRASIYILDTIFTCSKEIFIPLISYIG